MPEQDGGGASRTTDPAAGTSTATDVDLREYLNRSLGYESKITKLLVGGVFFFSAFAWSEIQRRLEILNHENARLLAQQEKTVSQDTYAANEQQRKGEQIDLQEWRKEVDRDRQQSITRTEFQQDLKVDKRAGIGTTTAVISACVALVVVVLAILNYQALHRDSGLAPTVTVTVPK